MAGLNIDGGRIEYVSDYDKKHQSDIARGQDNAVKGRFFGGKGKSKAESHTPQGRYPANVILDEEAVAMLDEQAPRTGGGHWSGKVPKDGGLYKLGLKPMEDKGTDNTYAGASRFFYCAKASKAERNAGCEGLPKGEPPASARSKPAEGRIAPLGEPRTNHHPTVKPLALMEYLCTLTKTPTGGLVLDPFCGSGTTCIACINTERDYIGIEKDPEYVEIAKRRTKSAKKKYGLFE